MRDPGNVAAEARLYITLAPPLDGSVFAMERARMRSAASRTSIVLALTAGIATIFPSTNFSLCLGASRSLRDNGNATMFAPLLLSMVIPPPSVPEGISISAHPYSQAPQLSDPQDLEGLAVRSGKRDGPGTGLVSTNLAL